MSEEEVNYDREQEGPRTPPPNFRDKIKDWRSYLPSIVAVATVFVIVRPMIKHGLSDIGLEGLALVAGTGALTGCINFSIAEYLRQRRQVRIELCGDLLTDELRRMRAIDKRKIALSGLKGGIIIGGLGAALWLGDTYLAPNSASLGSTTVSQLTNKQSF